MSRNMSEQVFCFITRQVVWSLELVGDVATLEYLKNQVLTLRLYLLLQSDLYLSHDLGLYERLSSD